MSAAYFTTIGSIRLQLAEKADSELVERIDKSLVRLEVLIRESTVGKDDFFKFSNEVESRLSRIESYLTDKPKGKK
jgi:predicted metal-dependent RNase